MSSAYDGFVDLLAGKVVGTKRRRPKRLAPDEVRERQRRLLAIRRLIQHADAMGFQFDDEYSDSPRAEADRILEELAESRHKGYITEEIRKGSLFDEFIADNVFNANMVFQRGWEEADG